MSIRIAEDRARRASAERKASGDPDLGFEVDKTRMPKAKAWYLGGIGKRIEEDDVSSERCGLEAEPGIGV